MKSILIFLLFFFAGVILTAGYRYWDRQQSELHGLKSTVDTKFSVENAPGESLKGNIASISGTVNWLSRTAVKPIQPKLRQSIQQGEELSTQENGTATVSIKKDTFISLFPNSHIRFIQLLPVNNVVVQDSGTISYHNNLQVPLNVRSYDLLTIITKGIVSEAIDTKSQTVAITVKQGTIQEGYEDLQHISNVVTVDEGHTFVFDETTRVGTLR